MAATNGILARKWRRLGRTLVTIVVVAPLGGCGGSSWIEEPLPDSDDDYEPEDEEAAGAPGGGRGTGKGGETDILSGDDEVGVLEVLVEFQQGSEIILREVPGDARSGDDGGEGVAGPDGVRTPGNGRDLPGTGEALFEDDVRGQGEGGEKEERRRRRGPRPELHGPG